MNKLQFKPFPIYYENEGYDVYNKKNKKLGIIYKYGPWKCAVWEQKDEMIMSSDCLQQVIDKMKELDGESKDGE
jgi:hypothetical protein